VAVLNSSMTRLLYMTERMKAISEGSRENVKAPFCCLSCKSSATLQLFKESTALLQTIDCRKVWGKQPTGTEQGSTQCSVWNSRKCPANTAGKLKKYNWQSKYGCMQRCLPATYPVKAVTPFGSSNNELHSCRILIAEKHGANHWQEQSKAPLTVCYEFHTSPRQEYSNQFAEQTMSPNNSVVFHLIMVQRNGEKRSWITSGSHTSIGIHWHPFGVLETDDYRQNNHLRFGDKLIFVNYIYMNKKEFK
jgi:hypothetical protein